MNANQVDLILARGMKPKPYFSVFLFPKAVDISVQVVSNGKYFTEPLGLNKLFAIVFLPFTLAPIVSLK